MQFEQEVRSFLKEHGLGNNEESLLPESDFPVIRVSGHPVLLHCMALNHPALNRIDAGYFSHLSDLALQQGNRLIHLWEDHWQQQKELVQLRILALAGHVQRIHARQTEIARIDKTESEDFLDRNHLQKSTTAYYKYALYHKDEPVAVATFSKSRTMHDGPALYRSYELVRFASKKGSAVNGGLSKLLNHFIMQHHPAHLMTYADRDWGSGEGYKKLGFVFAGNTPAQEFLIHPSTLVRIYPHRLPAAFSAADEMTAAGYVRIYNAGNSKFILDRRNI